MIGVPVPIEAMRRQKFHYVTRESVEPIPAMRRMGAPRLRSLQDGYLSGYTNRAQPRGFNWDVEYAKFEDVLWPQLAEQSAAFEAIKLKGAWVGHYDMNLLDGEPIIDRCPEVPNFILAAGFSGHGLMHAPAVDRAVRELILEGGFRSIDLARLSRCRVFDGQPLTLKA